MAFAELQNSAVSLEEKGRIARAIPAIMIKDKVRTGCFEFEADAVE